MYKQLGLVKKALGGLVEGRSPSWRPSPGVGRGADLYVVAQHGNSDGCALRRLPLLASKCGTARQEIDTTAPSAHAHCAQPSFPGDAVSVAAFVRGIPCLSSPQELGPCKCRFDGCAIGFEMRNKRC